MTTAMLVSNEPTPAVDRNFERRGVDDGTSHSQGIKAKARCRPRWLSATERIEVQKLREFESSTMRRVPFSIRFRSDDVRNGDGLDKIDDICMGGFNAALQEVRSAMMRRQPSVSGTVFWCLGAFGLMMPGAAVAEQDSAVAGGVQFLKAHAGGRPVGETAMIAWRPREGRCARLRSGLGGLPGQDSDAIHECGLFAGAWTGTGHLRGSRDGDGPGQPRRHRISGDDRPCRRVPQGPAECQWLVGL